MSSTSGTDLILPSENSQIIFEPKDYQREAIKFLLEHPEAGLFLATGLGKTITFLSAFHILKSQGIVNKALVIAKRRIIHNVWPREVEKWGLDLKVVKVHGSERKRLAALEEDGDLYLLTYQGIDWLSKVRPKALAQQWDVLCLDESSMVKNWGAIRSRRLRKMLPYFDRRVIMTASPIPRSMMDIFSQIYCLDMGGALGQFIGRFRNKYWYPAGYMGREYELQEDGEERIYEDIKDLVLRFPKDVIDLPPLHRIERVVQLPADARKHYRELEELFVTELTSGKVVASNAGVASQKLRQMAGGAIYDGISPYDDGRPADRARSFTTLHDAKIAELEDLVQELQGEPLLVAYEFDHERRRIQEAIDAPHIGGGTPDEEADRLIQQWNAGELPVLLGHPDSIAHGLNLQESGWNICFFGIGWNLENHSQFIDRVYRQGQEHAVWVYLIVAEDTIDELIIDTLAEKDATQERLFEALQTTIEKRMSIHDWKKVKLPGKLPATDKVVKIWLKYHEANWRPEVDHSKSEEWAVFGLANSIIVSMASWGEKRRLDFLREVFGKRPAYKQDLAEIPVCQRAIFDALKLDSVDAEAPVVVRKGKSGFGYARVYISKAPAFTLGAWPYHINDEETTVEEKSGASKFGGKGKKAPAKKAAAKGKAPAKKGGDTGRGLNPKGRVKRGKKEPTRGVHADIRNIVNESKGTILSTLVDQCAKRLDNDKAKDPAWVAGYVRGGIRRGYLTFED